MRLFTDYDLETYASARESVAVAKASLARNEDHAWEVRRLKARVEDAERERDRFKAGYRRGFRLAKKLRTQLADARKQLLAAGLESEVDDQGKPKTSPVQHILDEIKTVIPGIDDMAETATRAYIERELRKRGVHSQDAILAEVLAGGYVEDEAG